MTEPIPTASRPKSVWHNWITLAGAIIAAGALFSFLFLLALDVIGQARSNPYLGILTYLVAPAFLILGVLLVLAGAWHQYRHREQSPAARPHRLSIDLSRPGDRRTLAWFAVGGMGFALLSAVGSYQTFHYSESVQFCGEVCHTVMQPEFTAYQHGAHARVDCVECHVGAGASWYIKAKINGLHQVYGILRHNYPRPIPAPVTNMRPSRETCEQCHWPQKYTGDLDKTRSHYLTDDKSTPFTVRLLVKVGGGSPDHGPVGGIHWHMLTLNKVEYFATDPQRQAIPWVRVTAPDGHVTVYRADDFKGEPNPARIRRMDCMDCHNRPAHRYSTPDAAVDEALYLGRVDERLPGVKRTAVDLLTKPYPNQEAGKIALESGLRQHYPGKSLEGTIAAVQAIYRDNFFPEMKADWSHYPDNLGHLDSPGCFRCHDGKHLAVGNRQKMPATDCDTCHTILAQGAGADLARVAPAGLRFKHPSSNIEGTGLICSDCHNGKNQEN